MAPLSLAPRGRFQFKHSRTRQVSAHAGRRAHPHGLKPSQIRGCVIDTERMLSSIFYVILSLHHMVEISRNERIEKWRTSYS